MFEYATVSHDAALKSISLYGAKYEQYSKRNHRIFMLNEFGLSFWVPNNGAKFHQN